MIEGGFEVGEGLLISEGGRDRGTCFRECRSPRSGSLLKRRVPCWSPVSLHSLQSDDLAGAVSCAAPLPVHSHFLFNLLRVFFGCELWNTSYSIYWYVIYADAPPSNVTQHSMFVGLVSPFVVSVSLSSLDTSSWLESGSKWSFTCISLGVVPG